MNARTLLDNFNLIADGIECVRQLKPKEREVLELLATGLLYKEIAGKLDCSVYTINAHVRQIYEKLQVHSRSQAVAKFRAR